MMMIIPVVISISILLETFFVRRGDADGKFCIRFFEFRRSVEGKASIKWVIQRGK